MLGRGEIEDSVVISHDNVSDVPGVLLDFRRFENSNVACVLMVSKLASWDQKFIEL